MTKFGNLGTPSISRELLKLETRNLACKRTPRGTKEKMKNWLMGVTRGSRDQILESWDPLHIISLRFRSMDIITKPTCHSDSLDVYPASSQY